MERGGIQDMCNQDVDDFLAAVKRSHDKIIEEICATWSEEQKYEYVSNFKRIQECFFRLDANGCLTSFLGENACDPTYITCKSWFHNINADTITPSIPEEFERLLYFGKAAASGAFEGFYCMDWDGNITHDDSRALFYPIRNFKMEHSAKTVPQDSCNQSGTAIEIAYEECPKIEGWYTSCPDCIHYWHGRSLCHFQLPQDIEYRCKHFKLKSDLP